MIQLLIIADDFIGALDTGVQFASNGAQTQVTTDVRFDFKNADPDVRVLVMDADTRTLAAESAYRTVAGIVHRAQRVGVPYIYKKTDSSLRGNVGAELAALCDATGAGRVHFIPAYPDNGRITRNGIQYINEVPVSETLFGQDPEFPVKTSCVAELIKQQVDVAVHNIQGNVLRMPHLPEGVLVYDCETETQMEQIAYGLSRRGELAFCAGCAGFVGVLPRLLGLVGPRPQLPVLNKQLLVLCGSENPSAMAQVNAAEQEGITRVHLNAQQKFQPEWAGSEQAAADLDTWAELCKEKSACILDSNPVEGSEEDAAYAQEHGLDALQKRANVSAAMGMIMSRMLKKLDDATVMVIGGGSMLQFMRQAQVSSLKPICEIAPGTVLMTMEYEGKQRNVICKPGVFGREKLICDVLKIVQDTSEK